MRLDELLLLDPEPPRAQSDVLDLPFEELTGDPEAPSTVAEACHFTRTKSARHSGSLQPIVRPACF